MKACLLYSLAFGLLSAILLCILAKPICVYLLHNKVSSYLFYIIAFSLPFISISSCLNGYFTALRKNGKNAITRIFEQFIKICFTSYLISFFMPNGINYACLSLVLGEAFSEVLSCLFAFVLYLLEKKSNLNITCKNGSLLNFSICTRLKNLFKKHSINNFYLKSILEITVPVSITSYIRSLLSSLKQLLIPIRLEKFGMSCKEAISSYGIINGMAMPVLMFPEVIINSFSGLLVPEFTYYYTKKNYDKISIAISKIFRISLIFSIVIIGIFLFYSENISMLIYNNYDIAIILKVLCPLLLFMYLDSIVDNILKGLNEQISVMKCNILDLFVSIICIYILLPLFGINGYIMVIFISEILNSGISILQLKKITNFKFDFKNWILIPFFSVVISYIITEAIIRNPCCDIISFCLKMFFFTSIYFLCSSFLLVICNYQCKR